MSALQPEDGARDAPGSPVAADGRTEPRVLSVDELTPIAVALEHRRRQQQRGHRLILHPLPKCPTCGARPDELLESERLLTDLEMAWLPCGHRIVVDNKTVYSVACRAQQIVDAEQQQPAGARTADPARCPHGIDADPGHDWCGPFGSPEHCADCGMQRAATAPICAEDVLRAHVRAALRNAGLSQAAAAELLGVSEKHLSQLLTGRAQLTLTWAERLLALCGRRLTITLNPIPDDTTGGPR